MKKLFALLLCLCVLCGAASLSTAEDSGRPVVRISVANAGDIYVELYPEIAPVTVENFLALADAGFYDGLTFHRIISGFMVQGGDPSGNGTGGSAQRIKGEFAANGVANDLSHTRGVISMARSSDMDSASSQFFIVHADSTYLDGNYAAFGRVLAGIGVVDRLCATTYVTDSNGTVMAGHAPVITSVTRADRAEAEEAMAREAANGQTGGTFADPTSFASVTVPEGWSLEQSLNGTSVFVRDDGTGSGIVFLTLDLFAYAAGINTTGRLESGLAREDMDTAFFGKASLMGFVGVEDELLLEEDTRGGHSFYRTTVRSGGLDLWCVIGAENGVIYAFAGDADTTEAVDRMLDTLLIP